MHPSTFDVEFIFAPVKILDWKEMVRLQMRERRMMALNIVEGGLITLKAK